MHDTKSKQDQIKHADMYCEDCKENVEVGLYNVKCIPRLYYCRECGQIIKGSK